MVNTYTIFGRQFGSHVLALATLGTTGLGVFGLRAYLSSGNPKPQGTKPAINASSKEEEEFIQEFIKNVNAEEQKTKH